MLSKKHVFLIPILGLLLSLTFPSAAQKLGPNQKVSFPGEAAIGGLPNVAKQKPDTYHYYGHREKFIADVDGDGRLDYIGITDRNISTARGASSTHFDPDTRWGGNTDSRFKTALGIDLNSSFSRHDVLDVNGDGKADLVSVSDRHSMVLVTPGGRKSGTRRWHRKKAFFDKSKQQLSAHLPPYGYPIKDFADVNNDGYVDFIGLNGDVIGVALGSESGFFGLKYNKTLSDGGDSIGAVYSYGVHYGYSFKRLLDVNGDGYLDFVGIEGDSTVVALGSADGSFDNSPTTLRGHYLEAEFKDFADVNGDGHQDLVAVLDDQAYVVLGSQAGLTSYSIVQNITSSATTNPFTSQDIELLDVNQDGYADLIALWPQDGLAVYVPGTATGRFDTDSAITMQDTIFSASTTHIHDFNKDGRPDFFAVEGETAWLAHGLVTGGFDTANMYTTQSRRFADANDKRLTDINNDGIPDLILFGDPIELKQGLVFRCSCKRKSYPGTHFFPRWSSGLVDVFFDSKVPLDKPIIAQFDTGSLFKPKCYCAVVTDLNQPWIPSIGRDNRYATSCVGLCGAQCGKNEAGILESEKRIGAGMGHSRKRYANLVKHDVCQAFIGSTTSFLDHAGRRNACGDEAFQGAAATVDSLVTQPHQCTDGDLVEEHINLIPHELLPPH